MHLCIDTAVLSARFGEYLDLRGWESQFQIFLDRRIDELEAMKETLAERMDGERKEMFTKIDEFKDGMQ